MRVRHAVATALVLSALLVPQVALAREVTFETSVAEYPAGTTFTVPDGDEWVEATTITEDDSFALYARSSTNDKAQKVDLYRLYNPYTGEHLYTISATERDYLVEEGWEDEGGELFAGAPSVGQVFSPEVDPGHLNPAVYRLYNPYAPGGDHHYTTDKNEYEELQKAGWKGEGIAFYSAPFTGMARYRLYNPYAETGAHHYTCNGDEVAALVDLGWRNEGVAWFLTGFWGQ